MKNKLLVGITGQTGAGKSTVCGYLRDMGYPVIDGDLLSRQVTSPGSECLAKLAKEFGGDIVNPDGSLNRAKLASIAFADDVGKAKLNGITHPYILKESAARVEALFGEGAMVVFLDAPTLFESGADKNCDAVISVIAPRKVRLSRVTARDGITQDRAAARMSAQHGDDYYTRRSHLVIENNGSIPNLLRKTDEALRVILTSPGGEV